jgi:outer membrane immunogenic protein
LLTQGEFSNNFYEIRHKVDWTNRTVAKVGYLLTDKILLSSNGGMAFVHSSLASSAGYSSSDTRMGWTVGAEVEYMLTDKLGVTASYNHKSIKDLTYEGSSLFGLIDNFHQYDLKMNSFSTGVNYHF